MTPPVRVVVAFGTRPEAIKMAPVVHELRARPEQFDLTVCATAQHREMQDQALAVFGIDVDYDLDLMTPGQTLDDVVAGVVTGVGSVLRCEQPRWVLVQGDTSSAFAAGLAAFHNGVKVGHVEAGLRTGLRSAPFPEEVNRRMVTCFADLHFAPTEHAARALIDDGADAVDVLVTGNTVVDALQWVLAREPTPLSDKLLAVLDHPTILVTGHRRESFGEGFEQICSALSRLAQAYPEHRILYPVHLNPRVRGPVMEHLGAFANVVLAEPLGYTQFVQVMTRISFIITDSGGIQEEATALAKPVLVMRDVTERPEAVAAGVTELVGTDADRIVERATALIEDPTVHNRASETRNLYGDGKAAHRIAEALLVR